MSAQLKFTPPPAESKPATRYTCFAVTPRMPTFAAWVDGVDLSAEIDGATEAELRTALLEYGVLFFRKQKKLTPERHMALAHVFGGGPGGINPQIPREGAQIEHLYADDKSASTADQWHTDFCWQPLGTLGTLIQIQVLPAAGGNTSWRCTKTAYEWLSQPMKDALSEITAVHYWNNRRFARWGTAGAGALEERYRKMSVYPPVEHPVVLTHPITGAKSLFVNENFTAYLKDLHDAESEALLKMLYRWLRLPEFQIINEWEENGVAVWDNYRTQHYGMSDFFPERRVNQRVSFKQP